MFYLVALFLFYHILLYHKSEPLAKDSFYSRKIVSALDLDCVFGQVLHFLFFFQIQTNRE